ncbi:hypothetical protein J6590_013164 [Homalodisca vitripennis]|nr:hypothetical protein J6590_013164 [Homalodisca vitripennis]
MRAMSAAGITFSAPTCPRHPHLTTLPSSYLVPGVTQLITQGKHGNLKLKHGSSDTSFEIAHLVELNAANRISKGLSNHKWRVVLGAHCEVHYALPFLTGSSYSDAVGGVHSTIDDCESEQTT